MKYLVIVSVAAFLLQIVLDIFIIHIIMNMQIDVDMLIEECKNFEKKINKIKEDL